MNTEKYIIGLGCSWTQGEGGYPDEIWKQYNGKVHLINQPDEHLRKFEHENSWVNVLCRDHYPEYTPLNLGVRGSGNRAIVHQLHFCDKIDFNKASGYVILMLSGIDRFDVFRPHPFNGATLFDDGYSNGEYEHYKWRVLLPKLLNGGDEQPLYSVYANMLWSDQFVASETMMALLDIQIFCDRYNFKLITCNAFNPMNLYDYLKEHTGSLVNKFNWDTFIHSKTPYNSFMHKLVELDGKVNTNKWDQCYDYYESLNYPSKYLTNCIHPTIEGYKIIANELSKFID